MTESLKRVFGSLWRLKISIKHEHLWENLFFLGTMAVLDVCMDPMGRLSPRFAGAKWFGGSGWRGALKTGPTDSALTIVWWLNFLSSIWTWFCLGDKMIDGFFFIKDHQTLGLLRYIYIYGFTIFDPYNIPDVLSLSKKLPPVLVFFDTYSAARWRCSKLVCRALLVRLVSRFSFLFDGEYIYICIYIYIFTA